MFTYKIFNNSPDLFTTFDHIFNEMNSGCTDWEYPRLRLYENKENFVIEAEIPGISREDVDLQVQDNVLTIEGDKKPDYSDGKYLRKERAFGTFKKTIRLSEGIDRNRISADLKNGILTIELPKTEKAEAKRIEIK